MGSALATYHLEATCCESYQLRDGSLRFVLAAIEGLNLGLLL